MIKIFIKFIIAVIAVPLAAGVTIAFQRNIVLITEMAQCMRYFTWGIVSYAILHLLFYKPTYAYVLGHEAVHAGFSWLLGGKIKSFRVSEQGGGVATDKSNTLIELAPYFIPLYTALVTVVYFVVKSSYAIDGRFFIFLIGFTLAMHIVSTVEVLRIRQPDIVKSGYFFSIVLVYIMNIVVIAAIFSLVFHSFGMKKFFLDMWGVSRHIYAMIAKQFFL